MEEKKSFWSLKPFDAKNALKFLEFLMQLTVPGQMIPMMQFLLTVSICGFILQIQRLQFFLQVPSIRMQEAVEQLCTFLKVQSECFVKHVLKSMRSV